MSRREKSQVASKRRHLVVPTEASVDPRALAKHPIQHRGAPSMAPRRRFRRLNPH
jgi:hypothetical protein